MDWLIDRINLLLQIQIRYFGTIHQLADIMNTSNFTRDGWNNLLHLFNISHFSSTCCAENSRLISCAKTMAKRMRRTRRNSRPDEALSSQVKLKDAHFGALMDDSAGKVVATEENQVLWEFSESESWSIHEDEVTGKPVAYKMARWNLRHPVFQKFQESYSWKKEMATLFSTYPLQLCLTRTKSFRLWERLTIEDLWTKWRTSTWTRLFG